MSSLVPYPPIKRWIIPVAVLHATLRGVRPAGLRGVESGVLWLGHRAATAVISTVVMPCGVGVVETPQMWQVAAEVFGTISRWAGSRSLVMLGMFHIHIGSSVRMSYWDRERVVRVPDMLSAIGASDVTEEGPARWGWYVFEDAAYREMRIEERGVRLKLQETASCSVWTADIDSVREVS